MARILQIFCILLRGEMKNRTWHDNENHQRSTANLVRVRLLM